MPLNKRDIEHVRKEEQAIPRSCIVCGAEASHCMRGIPKNTYCKDCALDYFKFLNYLERL